LSISIWNLHYVVAFSFSRKIIPKKHLNVNQKHGYSGSNFIWCYFSANVIAFVNYVNRWFTFLLSFFLCLKVITISGFHPYREITLSTKTFRLLFLFGQFNRLVACFKPVSVLTLSITKNNKECNLFKNNLVLTFKQFRSNTKLHYLRFMRDKTR